MISELARVGSMTFGVILPNKGVGAGPELLDACAGTAQELHWRSAWVTDHLMVPRGDEAEEYGTILEALNTLTWVGARYSSLELGTSVISPAMRDAPMLAKELATIDVLLAGRLTVGVGASDAFDGPEYANLGKADRFAIRGAYVDETIRLWRHLWSGSTEPFHGQFHPLDDFMFLPLPVRSIPIWAGGRSARALRRAAELCDGYHGAQTGPLDLVERLPRLRAALAITGRPWPFVSTRARVKFGAQPGPVYALVGDHAQMVEQVRAFAGVGNDELIVVFDGHTPEVLQAQMRRFSNEVICPAAEQGPDATLGVRSGCGVSEESSAGGIG
jgi:alkanesulfonate monooxygenase SsuD/methylene tetrahydromethanopterin reductase-like flavin-dependent oxidoreductase (luciferase family)